MFRSLIFAWYKPPSSRWIFMCRLRNKKRAPNSTSIALFTCFRRNLPRPFRARIILTNRTYLNWTATEQSETFDELHKYYVHLTKLLCGERIFLLSSIECRNLLKTSDPAGTFFTRREFPCGDRVTRNYLFGFVVN